MERLQLSTVQHTRLNALVCRTPLGSRRSVRLAPRRSFGVPKQNMLGNVQCDCRMPNILFIYVTYTQIKHKCGQYVGPWRQSGWFFERNSVIIRNFALNFTHQTPNEAPDEWKYERDIFGRRLHCAPRDRERHAVKFIILHYSGLLQTRKNKANKERENSLELMKVCAHVCTVHTSRRPGWAPGLVLSLALVPVFVRAWLSFCTLHCVTKFVNWMCLMFN